MSGERARLHVSAPCGSDDATVAQQDGAQGEQQTRTLLGRLTAYGFHFLHDRKWPGTTAANIDHIGVGPSGVYVLDTKSWTGDLAVDDTGLWQGQQPRGDALDKLQQQANVARSLLADVGVPPVGVRPVLVLSNRDFDLGLVDGVWIIGDARLSASLLRGGKHLTVRQVEDDPLYALRKPYEVSGRQYRYWALLCAGCGTAREPKELPDELQKALRRLVKA